MQHGCLKSPDPELTITIELITTISQQKIVVVLGQVVARPWQSKSNAEHETVSHQTLARLMEVQGDQEQQSQRSLLNLTVQVQHTHFFIIQHPTVKFIMLADYFCRSRSTGR